MLPVQPAMSASASAPTQILFIDLPLYPARLTQPRPKYGLEICGSAQGHPLPASSTKVEPRIRG
jgi:hypothetical protein